MERSLGFDSSVLSAFARARRLDDLESLTAGYSRIVKPAVLEELAIGSVMYPALAAVKELPWLHPVVGETVEELVVFDEYVRALGEGTRNIGESSLLAWAEVSAGVAFIDDGPAVQIAKSRGVIVRRSLALIMEGRRTGLLNSAAARVLVDELVTLGGARFPCDGASFEAWAESHGLIVSSE